MIVDWLIKRAKRTPYHHLAGYMERWWLVPFKKDGPEPGPGVGPVAFRQRPIAWLLQQFDIAIRVHHILRSDLDRDPHDHPWSFVTVILRGGYWEKRYDEEGFFVNMEWHGPGSILKRKAADLHKLEIPEGETCWTLFITGKYQQSWGFKTPEGKVHWRKYRSKNA